MFILISVTVLALIFGAILGFASIKLKVEADPIVEKIDAILPQSQCGQCGYPGCKPYAEAIANGDVITKCVPGGRPTVVKIAEIMGVDVPAMDDVAEPEEMVAFIDENMCIGCTKCIQACPVDAIIGTNKAMHTIIPDLCTGCELLNILHFLLCVFQEVFMHVSEQLFIARVLHAPMHPCIPNASVLFQRIVCSLEGRICCFLRRVLQINVRTNQHGLITRRSG